MISKERKANPLIMALTICAFVVIFVFCLIIGLRGNGYRVASFSEPFYALEDAWLLSVDGKSEERVELPLKLSDADAQYSLTHVLRMQTGLDGTPSIKIFSYYMKFDVYLDDILLYHYPGQELTFSKTMGNSYHFISLPEDYAGKELRIDFTFTLNDTISYLFEAPLIGSKATMLNNTFMRELPILLIDTFSIIVGIAMLAIYAFLRMRKQYKRNVVAVFTGVFAIIFGIYSLSETDFIHYTVENSYLLYQITFSSLALLAAPLLMIFKDSVSPRFDRLITANVYLVFINFFAQIVLNYLGVLDFRETLIATHTVQFISIAIGIYCLIRTRPGESQGRKRMLYSAVPLLVGALIDLLGQYVELNKYNSLFFQIGVIIFILMQLGYFARSYVILYRDLVQNELYREMAFIDLLTGLGNRNAYERHLEELEQRLDKLGMLWCFIADINNLKVTNDTCGHAAGDKLITDTGNLILSAFPRERATAFRIGGDEFVVFIEGIEGKNMAGCVAELDTYIRDYNRQNDLKIDVAFGYARFNAAEGIAGLIARTDGLMYSDKTASRSGD